MGNLLKLGRKSSATEDSLTNENIFVDFENAEPTEEEKEVYDSIIFYKNIWDEVLQRLAQLDVSQSLLNKVINNPNDTEAQKEIWHFIVPVVTLTKMAHDLMNKFDEFFPILVNALCEGDHSVNNFERKQALSKLFAHLLGFAIDFDNLKMTKPVLINTFSYYRKCITRSTDDSIVIDNVEGQEVNNLILFLAAGNPCMTKLCQLLSKQVQKNSAIKPDGITESFVSLAKLCRIMLEKPNILRRFKEPNTKYFVKKFLCAVLIMYDNIHPLGLYVKAAQIDLRHYVKLIKDTGEGETDLVSCLRFTSKHFCDANASPSIKQLFD